MYYRNFSQTNILILYQVTIKGLTGAVELNEKTGVVKQYVGATGRWAVRLDGHTEGVDKLKCLKRGNIVLEQRNSRHMNWIQTNEGGELIKRISVIIYVF